MRTWQIGLIAWIVGCLIALLFAFVPAGATWQAFDRIVQVVNTFGTTAAAGVALWLGLRQANEGRQRDFDAAVVLAAGLCEMLEPALDGLHLAIAQCTFDSIPPPETEALLKQELEGQKQALLLAVSAPAFEHGFDTISKLAPLPNRCALRLYKACSMIRALAHEVRICEQGSWMLMTNPQRRNMLTEWVRAAGDAMDYFRHVRGDLKSLADREGAELTNEERYGPWFDDDA